jgi:general secretion pathway protein J
MRNEGFTLLEILIALFIFTIVSMIMVTVLHTLLSSQQETEKKSLRLRELETAFILISNDLEQTLNRPITNNLGAVESFVGTSRSVTFTHGGLVNPMGDLLRSSLQRTTYHLDDHGHFTRITWPVLDQTQKTQADQRILLNNIDDVHFEYLDQQGRFHSDWSVKENDSAPLPKAVRLTLTLSGWGSMTQLYLIPGPVAVSAS